MAHAHVRPRDIQKRKSSRSRYSAVWKTVCLCPTSSRLAVTQYLSRPQMTLSPILREAYVKHVWPSHPSRWPEVKPWPARTSHLCAVHREGQPHTRWGAECPSSSRCFMVTCPVGFITVTVPWHNVVFMKHPEEIPLGSLPTSVS